MNFNKNSESTIDIVFMEELGYWDSEARRDDVLLDVYLNVQGIDSLFDDVELICWNSCLQLSAFVKQF